LHLVGGVDWWPLPLPDTWEHLALGVHGVGLSGAGITLLSALQKALDGLPRDLTLWLCA
jgi:hypothetical protein